MITAPLEVTKWHSLFGYVESKIPWILMQAISSGVKNKLALKGKCWHTCLFFQPYGQTSLFHTDIGKVKVVGGCCTDNWLGWPTLEGLSTCVSPKVAVNKCSCSTVKQVMGTLMVKYRSFSRVCLQNSFLKVKIIFTATDSWESQSGPFFSFYLCRGQSFVNFGAKH